MSDKLLYEIALTLVKGVGSITGRKLLTIFQDAKTVFSEAPKLAIGMSPLGASVVAGFRDNAILHRAEKELEYITRNQIEAISILNPSYPTLLKSLSDAPLMLYYKGTVNLNSHYTYSVVGTRKISSYGKQMTEELVKGIYQVIPDAVVVSGLAYGVDITAHRAALEIGAPTIAVLAHGLDRIYPYQHRKEAELIMERGGLLTEFINGTQPERYNFVARNRIVAGMTPATIVIESGEKGGSLITAEIASSYSREVFAVPGRTNDSQSVGCNRLIQRQKAEPLLSPNDLIRSMNWSKSDKQAIKQMRLFPDLSPEETEIVAIIEKETEVHINDLIEKMDLAVYELSPILLELEFKGMIRSVAGGKYKMI